VAGVRFGFHDENGAGGPDGELAAVEGNAFTNHGVSWRAFQPTPMSVTGSMDAACDFSAVHDLYQVGFHYVWDQLVLDDLADWVLDIDDPDELRQVLRERVRLIFERCPGLDRIDVLNEPFGTLSGSSLYVNHFHQVLGADYVAELFRIVRAEAPAHVQLFLNENFIEYFPARAEAYVALVRDLVQSGAPVDAVGVQTHLLLVRPPFAREPDWALYRRTLEELAALGVAVFVTELDVPVPPGTPNRFAVQAERYRRVVEICLAVPACDTIIVWGISDAATWLDDFDLLSGPDPDPLLFDDALHPKPAYFSVRDALLRGRGGDHPIGGDELFVTRGFVSLRSSDRAAKAPSPGSTNDPRHGDPGGATLELLLPDGSGEVFELAPGPGWQVRPGETTYREAATRGPPLWLRLREGHGVDLRVWGSSIGPAAAREGLRVRLRLGTLRLCTEFGPETVVARSPGRVLARDAPRALDYDCGD